jgi:pimeloyl-ACP methyl ester carboxylesterase
MPVLEREGLKVDYLEEGSGPTVLLLHSSVSGNRQWKRLMEDLRDRFRVLAVNLLGYGQTTPWSDARTQRLEDQVRLVELLLADVSPGASLVGHSFGGIVAMKAAAMLGERVSNLVLIEANPFYLLRQNGRADAYAEIKAIRDHVKEHGARGDWTSVAERFADYWNGAGSWAAMPPDRQAAFARACAPNFHEWDAVMDEPTTLEGWSAIRARTLLVQTEKTVRPIAEIYELLRAAFPRWSFASIAEGGHMAPLTRPELVNPVVAKFLSAEER